MRIEFEMSGGFGGLFAAEPLRLLVDTNDVAEPAREELLALIDGSGLLAADAGRAPAAGAQRDAMQYRITLADGTPKVFAFDDVTVPPDARPLLERLRTMAIEERAQGR